MKLYLDSRKSVNNKFTLDAAIEGKWELISFVSTNNIFNVNTNNNKVYLFDGSDVIATLPVGSYDITDLKTALATAINDVASSTYTVSVDLNTNKYTITNTDDNEFHFTFGSNTTNSARQLLGFNGSNGDNSTTHTSDNPVDLNPHKNLFINICENDDRDVTGQSYFNTSLVINGNGAFGEIMRYVKRDNFNQFLKFRNTKNIEVKFHDLNHKIIELNSDYVIILEKVF